MTLYQYSFELRQALTGYALYFGDTAIGIFPTIAKAAIHLQNFYDTSNIQFAGPEIIIYLPKPIEKYKGH